MKSTVLFSWALLHLCLAYCPLHLPEPVLFDALNTAGLVGDDPSMFTLLGLTYLCYTRSLVDVMRFDQVRVSVLYTYGTDVPQSAQATFECIGIMWTPAPVRYVTQHKHIFQDLTREGCQDCLDQSKFAKPTYCRLDDPCGAAPCANGGNCSRTGLTDFSCRCDGSWSGAMCKTCDLKCQNGGTLNASTCTCNCVDGFSGDDCESNQTTSCSRVCQNGGTINAETCMCHCEDGYSGTNCEIPPVKVHCNRTCQNGGSLDEVNCVCNCADGYNGDDCENCSLACANGGTLDAGNCTCHCADGFSGSSCGRKFSAKKVKGAGVHGGHNISEGGGGDGGGGGLGAGAIVGIAVGGAALLAVGPTVLILINMLIVGA